MLLSPLTLPEAAVRRRPAAKPAAPRTIERMPAYDPQRRPVPPILVAWLAIGACTWWLVPAARGDARWGATLPFWLVAAPAIGLAWTMRVRWIGATLGICRRYRVAAPVQAYRRSAEPRRRRADRSSR